MIPGTTRFLLAAALAAGLPGCDSTADPAQTAAATRHYGRIAFEPCTLASGAFAGNVQAQCARFQVPENRAAPDGRKIELALAWLPATEEGSAVDDPVFFFAGGPGQSALRTWPQIDPAFAQVRKQRHVVLIDQRGTGGSNPLECEDEDEESAATPDPGELAAFAGRCAERLGDRADPRFYTTMDAIADVEAVREAIGTAKIDLVGVSYGTRVAQQYAARHPQHVRSLVLDGVAPNDLVVGGEFAHTFEDALALQSEKCRQLPACAARFPQDARTQLAALVERLRQAPVDVEYRDPASAQSHRGTVDADTVTGLAFLFSYMPQTASLLPLVLDEAGQGRYAPLMSLHELMGRSMGGTMARGMQWSVICAEDADRYRDTGAADGTLLGPDVARMFFAACAGWPHGGRPRDFTAPLRSQAPALLVSGELDPVTPPRYGERVLAGLGNGRHLVAQGQGHGNLGSGCMPRLVAQFLESADAGSLDATCLDTMAYVPPFTSFNGWEP
ncbi:alpha/beta hydrolase [Pseudoxanthomonas broegbernensis]|uniref:Alpha/beta hydrolase n=1 Tax=Pseudoxanthomonas broegbernensis TaxID=83619 RepID=A0A7V8K7F3_9GAMM|nr:alpha/beta hydrolase [Pseudoxanthomonas broegbernensis]KAF1686842.1 alpha/beta hydrolase [Pseudoxanthomonas broegbernensis]MBB6065572.1 pimeloyl-ACP methyl ester carboxylesterase [Pseudoxanthomonas broegbernensis]